jgi:hypothetical protein
MLSPVPVLCMSVLTVFVGVTYTMKDIEFSELLWLRQVCFAYRPSHELMEEITLVIMEDAATK